VRHTTFLTPTRYPPQSTTALQRVVTSKFAAASRIKMRDNDCSTIELHQFETRWSDGYAIPESTRQVAKSIAEAAIAAVLGRPKQAPSQTTAAARLSPPAIRRAASNIQPMMADDIAAVSPSRRPSNSTQSPTTRNPPALRSVSLEPTVSPDSSFSRRRSSVAFDLPEPLSSLPPRALMPRRWSDGSLDKGDSSLTEPPPFGHGRPTPRRIRNASSSPVRSLSFTSLKSASVTVVSPLLSSADDRGGSEPRDASPPFGRRFSHMSTGSMKSPGNLLLDDMSSHTVSYANSRRASAMAYALTPVVESVLYVGSHRDVCDFEAVADFGIRAFLCVAEEVIDPLPPFVTDGQLAAGAFAFKHVLISDNADTELADYIAEIFDFIDEQASHGRPVALYCHQGKSRSAAFAVAYLMREHSMESIEALELLQSMYPRAEPNFFFLHQLREIAPHLPSMPLVRVNPLQDIALLGSPMLAPRPPAEFESFEVGDHTSRLRVEVAHGYHPILVSPGTPMSFSPPQAFSGTMPPTPIGAVDLGALRGIGNGPFLPAA
jgi:protein-tyrosine phosphatase